LHRPYRFVDYFLLFLATLCLLTQCGLEYIPYLSEPVSLGANDADKTYKFIRTGDNTEAEFLGFEIYYKFYITSQEPDDTITTFSALFSNGFKRLSSSSDLKNLISKPLIKIPSGNTNTITFTLDFNQAPIPKDPETGSNDPAVDDVFLRRAVYYEPGEGSEIDSFKHFPDSLDDTTETYQENDSDIDSSVWLVIEPPTGEKVRLALYVLSYGRKDYTVDIYSDALYLGYVTINFGW